MTPRQLMGLVDQHREFNGTATRNGQPMTKAAPSRGGSTQGSAGWLMAVAGGLNRGRPAPSLPPMTAPGVG